MLYIYIMNNRVYGALYTPHYILYTRKKKRFFILTGVLICNCNAVYIMNNRVYGALYTPHYIIIYKKEKEVLHSNRSFNL